MRSYEFELSLDASSFLEELEFLKKQKEEGGALGNIKAVVILESKGGFRLHGPPQDTRNPVEEKTLRCLFEGANVCSDGNAFIVSVNESVQKKEVVYG